MSMIIAGRFETQEQGADALSALQDKGFGRDALSLFYVNPPGQHNLYPVGGDEDESPGARDADKGAAAGGGVGALIGAALGAVALSAAGPAGILVAAGAGAYAGSLAGAVSETTDETETPLAGSDPRHHADRHAGICVAVRMDQENEANRERVVETLKAHKAVEVEQAQGHIEGGDWTDFDPREVVRLI